MFLKIGLDFKIHELIEQFYKINWLSSNSEISKGKKFEVVSINKVHHSLKLTIAKDEYRQNIIGVLSANQKQ